MEEETDVLLFVDGETSIVYYPLTGAVSIKKSVFDSHSQKSYWALVTFDSGKFDLEQYMTVR